MFSGITNPYDKETYYSSDYASGEYYAPSPYKNNGSFNNIYSETKSPSSTKNSLSDLDGIGNTKKLCQAATGDTWNDLTNPISISHVGKGYSQAACCCYRYNTYYTERGNWYLPANGELGYLAVRQKKIDETIDKLREAYDFNIISSIPEGIFYLSSSERSSETADGINMISGGVIGVDKRYGAIVVAYLRVLPDGHPKSY